MKLAETESALTRVARYSGLALLIGLCVLAVWLGSAAVLIAIVAIVAVVMLHEFGHFITARWCGMKVTDYFLGFGPRLWSFSRGGVNYGIRLIPAGGFVRIIGMNSADAVEPVDEQRTYRVKSFPKRALVVSAGSIMHFLIVVVVFFAIHAFTGMPEVNPERWEVGEVPVAFSDGTLAPAFVAGIRPGDRIVALDSTPTPTWAELVAAIGPRAGDTVRLDVERGDQRLTVPATLVAFEDGRGRLGISHSATIDNVTQPLPVAAVFAVRDLGRAVWLSLGGLWTLVTNLGGFFDAVATAPGDASANENLNARPISLIGLVDLGSGSGVSLIQQLLLFAVFNAFIGTFNMLPLPPLDGGHLAIAVYERWRERGRSERYLIDMRRLMPVVWTVIAFAAALGLGAMYLDIANPLNFGL